MAAAMVIKINSTTTITPLVALAIDGKPFIMPKYITRKDVAVPKINIQIL